MAGELVGYRQFEFKGESLPYLADTRGQYLGVARVCLSLGLDPAVEWREILQRDAFVNKVRVETLSSGKSVYFLEAKALHAWLFTIASARVPAAYRARHTEWCEELIDAIYRYETSGVAVNEDVVGPDARRRIEAIAEQARASRLAECRQFYEIARRDMPGDAILKARAEQMVRQIISREAGASGDRGPGAPDTIAGILGSVSCFWPDKAVNSFGTPVANEYRRRYGKDPERTNQYGSDSEPGTNSGRSVFPRCYPRVDWPWILDMARRYARDRKLPVPA